MPPTDPPAAAARADVGVRPSDDPLQLIADGVTDIAGFGVAVLGVVRGDQVEMVAVAGDDAASQELLGALMPVQYIIEEAARAEDWGRLKFVPHGGSATSPEDWIWIPDIEVSDDPEAWHPHDLLFAPLCDEHGTIRGTLSIDLPLDGRRPGPEARRLLNVYAEQAERALLVVLAREELAQQVRLAEAARTAVRGAMGQRSLDRILETCQPALVEGFRASGMWIQTFDEDGLGTGAVHTDPSFDLQWPDELALASLEASRSAWVEQRVVVYDLDQVVGIGTDQATRGAQFMSSLGVATVLLVPIGAGGECLGNLTLTRAPGQPEWSDVETAAALEVGRDLGGAILNIRAYQREHRLVRELQAVDDYKSELIATVSHELKNPLGSILGHLEMLESADGLPGAVHTSVSAMDRAARRLGKVVDDLLLLSKVGDPDTPIDPRPVDLGALLDEVVDLTSVAAERRGIAVEVDVPAAPVVALGDADELDRVLTNLVSNAVKYSNEGSTVRVSLRRRGRDVELVCADEGLGISAADQEKLFTEFFRSSNPAAVAQPGTGLGLAIVSRIVRRHGGRIEVESELGRGSTFRVRLPAA